MKFKVKKRSEMSEEELKREILYGKFLAWLGIIAALAVLVVGAVKNASYADVGAVFAVMLIVCLLGVITMTEARNEIRFRQLEQKLNKGTD